MIKINKNAPTTREVSMAKKVAKKFAGNMTKAVREIEKIKKGLSDYPRVADLLKQFNEEADMYYHEEYGFGEILESTEEKVVVLFPHGVEEIELDEASKKGFATKQKKRDLYSLKHCDMCKKGKDSKGKPCGFCDGTGKVMSRNEDNTNDTSDDGEGLDKVQPKALKKKFKDRKDKDIDNDGDEDESDEYLHNRRKTISKKIDEKEDCPKCDGKGCGHCDQKGYHESLEMDEGRQGGKTEHSGAKKGKGAYYGRKKDAKSDSNKARRTADKEAVKEEEEISELSKDEKKGEPLSNTINRLIKKHAPKSKARAKPYRPMRREENESMEDELRHALSSKNKVKSRPKRPHVNTKGDMYKGYDAAKAKSRAKPYREEKEEEISELKKSTYARYLAKAAKSARARTSLAKDSETDMYSAMRTANKHAKNIMNIPDHEKDPEEYKRAQKRMKMHKKSMDDWKKGADNRVKGIARAGRLLAREETQVEEETQMNENFTKQDIETVDTNVNDTMTRAQAFLTRMWENSAAGANAKRTANAVEAEPQLTVHDKDSVTGKTKKYHDDNTVDRKDDEEQSHDDAVKASKAVKSQAPKRGSENR